MLYCTRKYFRCIRKIFRSIPPIVKLIFWISILFLISVGYFIFIRNSITDNFSDLVDVALQLFLATVVAYLFVDYTFFPNQKMEYFDALDDLICEMKNNRDRILKFPQKIEENYHIWQTTNEWKWIGKKSSFTNWGDGQNFHLKFLPTSAYFNFINKGYFLNQEYLSLPTEHIAHFYQFCNRFSIEFQLIENQIRSSGKNKESVILTDCSGNICLKETESTSNKMFQIVFPFLNERNEFESKRELCDFIKNNMFEYYAYKNDLNEGLIGEYQIIKESLKNYDDIDTKCTNEDNF